MRTVLLLLIPVVACKGTPTEPPPPDCGIVGFADRDGDGYGNPQLQTSDCVEPVVEEGTDCNDANFDVNPGHDEECDGVDNDCDSLVDEDDDDLAIALQYPDDDGDGFGTGAGVRSCDLLADHSEVNGDCDDAVFEVNPSAEEVCDEGVDNDCNGLSDDDDPNLTSLLVFYEDADLDGFGGTTVVVACEQPAGTSFTSDDCDDTVATTFPGAIEICDGADQNCDGDPDTPQFAPDPCVPYEAPYVGTWLLTLEDNGTTVTCAGTSEVTLDRALTPDLQGTFTCTVDAPQGSWSATQTGAITGLFREDGTVEGTVEAFEGVSFEWTGAIVDDVLAASGSGLFISGGSWDVSFSFTLDYVDVPP
ncbi:MAG: putative metal-binding motif-containing protein [Myxococcota bacterium]